MVAEHLHAVAFLARNVGDIDHGYIHADISNVVGPFAVHETVTFAITESAVESIGISYGYCTDDTVSREECFATISDAFSLRHAM